MADQNPKDSRCKIRKTAKRGGFSLVELMVVIGILAILAGLLMPAMSRARRQANSALCVMNLRTLAQATQMYAEQYRGMLPRRGQGVQPTTIINRQEDWFNALPPLLKKPTFYELVTTSALPRPPTQSIWCCPDAVDSGQPYFWSYGMNMWLSVWVSSRPDRIWSVGPPSTMVLFADGPGNYCSVLPSSKAYSPVARHQGQVNLAFLDGHVASFPGTYIGCGTGLIERADVRWKVPQSTWTGP